jgi:hypothetical protein
MNAPWWRVIATATLAALPLAGAMVAASLLIDRYLPGLAVLIGIGVGFAVRRFAPGGRWRDRALAACATLAALAAVCLLLPPAAAMRAHGLGPDALLSGVSWTRMIDLGGTLFAPLALLCYATAALCAWTLAAPTRRSRA